MLSHMAFVQSLRMLGAVVLALSTISHPSCAERHGSYNLSGSRQH